MAKKPMEILMVRMPTKEKAALVRAAEDETLPQSTLMRVIVVEWLRRRNYLPPKSRKEGR